MAQRKTATVKRQRTHKMFIDSRDLITHDRNPSEYIYRLPETIPNAIQLRLRSFRVPYSPTFVVIRTSKWIANGTTLEQTDTVHQQAVALAALTTTTSVEELPRVMTMYKADGTVSLNVVECFTFTRTRDTDDAFRTYDVFICTGTLITSVRTDWRLQDPSASDSSVQDIPIVGTDSDTADDNGGAYAATDEGSSSVAVNIVEDNVYLKLDFGQGPGRLSSIRQVYPQWKSFQVFRKGDFVCHDNYCYTCVNNHMSLIFDEDYAAQYWDRRDNIVGTSPAAANNVFYVIETSEQNESILTAQAAVDDVVYDFAPINVSQVNVEWVTRRGSHYIFPHSTAIEFESFTDPSNVATLKKEFRHHTLMLEILYEEETEVVVNADGSIPSSTGQPNFLKY